MATSKSCTHLPHISNCTVSDEDAGHVVYSDRLREEYYERVRQNTDIQTHHTHLHFFLDVFAWSPYVL